MRIVIRYAAVVVLAAGLFVWSCDDPNQEPAVEARIQAFSSTPGVVTPGEAAELRWHVSEALVLRLLSTPGSTMPDATQAWACTRERSDMVCTAPTMPSAPEGWTCSETDGVPTCRRPIESDTANYRPVGTGGLLRVVGSTTLFLDTTTTFRFEAEGNQGATDMAWVQVVVTRGDPGTRILDWTATPSPALVGEEVTLRWRTEGCEQVDVAADPSLREGTEWERTADSTADAGSMVWHEASTTRDFYLACRPIGGDTTERIRSHITVVVIQQPEVCERIELFDVNPAEINAGDTVTIRWRVANAEYVTSEPASFHVGSVQFEGERDLTVSEETTFSITAHGACGEATAEQTVTIMTPADGDGDVDADADTDADADADADAGGDAG